MKLLDADAHRHSVTVTPTRAGVKGITGVR
jgi:hypothetical protein